MAETFIVAVVLSTVAALTGGALVQWLSALAVLLSFMHGQVAERLAYRQKVAEKADVECWRWLGRYFVWKEIAWCAVFSLTAAWPALAGVVVFVLYPVWRAWWQRRGHGWA
jgi:hypothetical protein